MSNYQFNIQEGEPIAFFLNSAKDILERYKGKKNILVDIGAHIGTVPIMAIKEYGFKFAVAVEADLPNFARLIDNIQMNGCEGQILPMWAAVSNKSYKTGTLRSNNRGINSGCQSLKYTSKYPGEKVVLVTLQNVLDPLPKVNLLKIDIEGGEYDLLYETNKYAFEKADWIDMEVHDQSPDWNKELFENPTGRAEQVREYLVSCGYELILNQHSNGFYGPRKNDSSY